MRSAGMTNKTLEGLAVEYFKRSEGQWNSQRRYYMLNQETKPQEVESKLTVRYLEPGAAELIELAQLHQLESEKALTCGSLVTWESDYTNEDRKATKGSTIFGILGDKLYRDRGFATSKPIVAICYFNNPDTLCLRTEYGSSVFEEEVKLIGQNYRTRQTIISRAGQQITIGQYLEKRL